MLFFLKTQFMNNCYLNGSLPAYSELYYYTIFVRYAGNCISRERNVQLNVNSNWIVLERQGR